MGGILMSARSILFTLFGDVFLSRSEPVPLAVATVLLEPLNIGPEATRAALSRMAREGWFTSKRHGRQSSYQLTPRGHERLTHARLRIYRRADEPWDGNFIILGLTTSALAPSIRRNMVRELQFLGWASLGPYQWATPSARYPETMEILERYELQRTAWIVKGTLWVPDPVEWASKLYPMQALNERYQAFIHEWAGAEARLPEREAFVNRIQLVHAWRKFLFIDPGLPHDLAPPTFSRAEARSLFHRLYDQWYQPSTAFIEQCLGEALLLS